MFLYIYYNCVGICILKFVFQNIIVEIPKHTDTCFYQQWTRWVSTYYVCYIYLQNIPKSEDVIRMEIYLISVAYYDFQLSENFIFLFWIYFQIYHCNKNILLHNNRKRLMCELFLEILYSSFFSHQLNEQKQKKSTESDRNKW